jgi:hypothetical protein
MKHTLAFSIFMLISLLMACCLTTTIQRIAPNLVDQAKTTMATQAEGVTQKLAETLQMPSMEVPSMEAEAQTLVATLIQGAGQQFENTPLAPVPGSDGQAPSGVPAEFPVTQDAMNLQVLVTGDKAQINYQTKMSLEDVIGYCTAFLVTQGWEMRGNLTSKTEATFSIVFESSAKSSDIVIQGVKLGDLTNVNVRYEDVK